jgi:hypothetical protein
MKDRIDKLKIHADILLDAYLGLRENLEVLKPMIYEEAVARKHAAGNRARGFMVIQRTLFFSCVLDIVGLAFYKKDRRVPSFINLIEALKDEQLRNTLRHGYSRGEAFDNIWKNILTKWADFEGRKWVKPFKDIRDKRVAHLEVKKDGDEYKLLDINGFDLKWGDPEEAALLLEPIILDLMSAICNTGLVINRPLAGFEKDGKAFWT